MSIVHIEDIPEISRLPSVDDTSISLVVELYWTFEVLTSTVLREPSLGWARAGTFAEVGPKKHTFPFCNLWVSCLVWYSWVLVLAMLPRKYPLPALIDHPLVRYSNSINFTSKSRWMIHYWKRVFSSIT